MEVNHTLLSDALPLTVAFTVLARLCGSQANGTEMGPSLFTKNGEERKIVHDVLRNPIGTWEELNRNLFSEIEVTTSEPVRHRSSTSTLNWRIRQCF